MAAFGSCLCLILTLWMTGSRPPTVIPPRLPDSSPWWDQASLKIQHDALQLAQGRRLPRGCGSVSSGLSRSRAPGRPAGGGALSDERGRQRDCSRCSIERRWRLSYRRATWLRLEDHADLGGIDVNLSSLYLEMWDLRAAKRAAEEGLRKRAAGGCARGLLQSAAAGATGTNSCALDDGEARGVFTAGIEAARAPGICDRSDGVGSAGRGALAAGRLPEAENGFWRLFVCGGLFRRGDLGWSYGHLGALALARHDFGAAERLLNWRWMRRKRGAPARPEYLLLQQRGRSTAWHGERLDAALHDFSLALDATAEWRVQILPAQSSLISANIALEQQIFDSFIQLAAQHAFRTGNAAWTRARVPGGGDQSRASLRESLALADVWREKLAPEYWETLAQLGAEKRGAGTAGNGGRTTVSV